MKHNVRTSPLDSIRVASPCPARWDEMPGDERVRSCAECGLRVYNLSAMTRPEAEALVAEREGRLCVRFYQRADGRVMVRDCLQPLRAAARWTALRAAGLAVAVIGLAVGVATIALHGGARAPCPPVRSPQGFIDKITDWEPARTFAERLGLRTTRWVTMGDVAPRSGNAGAGTGVAQGGSGSE